MHIRGQGPNWDMKFYSKCLACSIVEDKGGIKWIGPEDCLPNYIIQISKNFNSFPQNDRNYKIYVILLIKICEA
jgi:hypothetical protein